jgi:hypothetical protein
MVEDLLLNKGKGRKPPVARVEEGLVPAVPLHAEERGQLPGTVVAEPVAEPVAARETEAPVITSPTRNLPTSKFATLGRRRRHGGVLLFLLLHTLNEDETATSNAPPRTTLRNRSPRRGDRPARTKPTTKVKATRTTSP